MEGRVLLTTLAVLGLRSALAAGGRAGAKASGSFKESPDFMNEIHQAYGVSRIKWPELLETSGRVVQLSNKSLGGRKPWCQARQFLLELDWGGCGKKRLHVRYCQGQCTSVFVPQGDGKSFSSCPSCVPSGGRWVTVDPPKNCRDRPSQRVFKLKKCLCKQPQDIQYLP